VLLAKEESHRRRATTVRVGSDGPLEREPYREAGLQRRQTFRSVTAIKQPSLAPKPLTPAGAPWTRVQDRLPTVVAQTVWPAPQEAYTSSPSRESAYRSVRQAVGSRPAAAMVPPPKKYESALWHAKNP